MNTIKIMRPVALLSPMLLLIGLGGCQNDIALNDRFDFSELSTDAFAVVDYYDVNANIQDASVETDMAMNPVFKANSRFQRHGGYRGGRGGHIGRILRQLEITEEQGAAIKDLIAAHRENVKVSFEALRAANQSVFDEARAERQAILESMRNGDITRDQAKAQLRALSRSKREAIANNPESAPYIDAICVAKGELFDNIRALLIESQQTGWDDWVAGLGGLCFGGG